MGILDRIKQKSQAEAAMARQAVQQAKKYFKPTEKVRVRDFVRELPKGIAETAKAVVRDTARFGLSVKEIPKTFQTGKASGKFYNTPLGRINSFQSESQNRVNRGDPLWKSIGNPALDTILAGSDIASFAKPLLAGAKSAKFLPKEARNIASDLIQPMRKTIQVPGIRTITREPVEGVFSGGVQQMRELPVPIKQNILMNKKVLNPFQSKTLNVRPGMNVQEVSGGKNPLIQEARKYKSAEIQKEFDNLAAVGEKRYKDWWKKNPTAQQTAENHSASTFMTAEEQSKLQDLGGKLERARYTERGITSQQDIKDIVQLKRNLRKQGVSFNENATKSQLTDIWNKSQPLQEGLPNAPQAPTSPVMGESGVMPRLGAGTAETPLMLPKGKPTANTPAQAKKIFQKTGETPNLNFQQKSGKLPIAPTDAPMSISQAKSFFQKTGKIPNFKNTKNGSGVIEAVEEGGSYTPLPKDIEEIVLGRKSFGGQAGKADGVYTKGARAIQEWIDNGVSKMAASQNMLVRGTARFLQGFAGQLGKNQQTVQKIGQYKGGVDWGRELANDAAQKVYSVLPDEAALKRVHSNLDPELYGGKTEKLSQVEQEAADYLRQISDWINDTNFSNKFITPEQWAKGRNGKYLARAYEAFDYPPEVADLIKQGSAKMDLGMFKKRGDLTDWKMDEAIRDPAYLVGKRLQQTIFNDTTAKMFGWMKGQADYVSDKARAGFTQLSDHRAYGDMAGKYVRNDVMEDIKGFFFTHQFADDAYKLLRAYGRNPIRRGLKASKTVLNPVTRLGNRAGNFLFAHLSGINPVTFAKNQVKAYELLKAKDPLVTRMIKDGILGTDFSKGEIVDASVDIVRNNSKNILRKGWDAAADSYGRTDDAAKVAAMKTFLDRGFSYEEASKKVASAFQNYRTVGKFYDIGSNMPVLGNAFVRFQADLQRILKNAVVEHPVRALGTVMAIKLFGDAMSAVSGEIPEEKQVRENRVGSPHIPYTDTSLAFQTPWGEVNASRWLGVFANTPVGGASATTDASKLLPIQNPLDKRNYGSDVMVGPAIGAAMDTDFRGKSTQDPNQSKYLGSTLTPQEKAMNVAKYLGRSYNLPVANDLIDVWSAVKGEKDFYGREKTVGQALAKLGGVKVEQYGPEQVAQQKERDAEFSQYKRDDAKKLLNKITKDYQTGTIDYNTYQKRLDNIEKDLSVPQEGDKKILENYSGDFSYIDSNGDRRTVKTRGEAEKKVAQMDLESDLKSGGGVEVLKNYKPGTLTTSMINDLAENGDIDTGTRFQLESKVKLDKKVADIKYVKSLMDEDVKNVPKLVSEGLLTENTVDDMFKVGAVDGKKALALQKYIEKMKWQTGKKKKVTNKTYNKYIQEWSAKYGLNKKTQIITKPQPKQYAPIYTGKPYYKP